MRAIRPVLAIVAASISCADAWSSVPWSAAHDVRGVRARAGRRPRRSSPLQRSEASPDQGPGKGGNVEGGVTPGSAERLLRGGGGGGGGEEGAEGQSGRTDLDELIQSGSEKVTGAHRGFLNNFHLRVLQRRRREAEDQLGALGESDPSAAVRHRGQRQRNNPPLPPPAMAPPSGDGEPGAGTAQGAQVGAEAGGGAEEAAAGAAGADADNDAAEGKELRELSPKPGSGGHSSGGEAESEPNPLASVAAAVSQGVGAVSGAVWAASEALSNARGDGTGAAAGSKGGAAGAGAAAAAGLDADAADDDVSVASSAEWARLALHTRHIEAMHLRVLLADEARCAALRAEGPGGIVLDYSRTQVTIGTMKLLLQLAEKQGLAGKIAAMLRGDVVNPTEGRPALHTATRADKGDGPILVDGEDVVALVHRERSKIKAFTDAVRRGRVRGHTGRKIKNVISVGIGGSYLGPDFINEVLATEREGIYSSQGMTLRFLSNVDPVDVERSVSGLDAAETLVVVVSKTFATAETMLNARTMRQWLWDRMSDGVANDEITARHVVACASESAAARVLAFGVAETRFFRFWDWVGGRYSVCSSAGLVPLSLKYGFDLVAKVLKGARSVDLHLASAPLDRNLPVLLGLLGVWNLSFMGYKTRTMLPYSEALCKFPAHVQQVDMESNGKGVTLSGRAVDYEVGEIDFGESGTNSQHSFFQLLHMGQPVPCDFIGFVESQNNLVHTEGEDLSAHDELMANFFAQPDALALGRTVEQLLAQEPGLDPSLVPHRVFPGNRPSISLLFPQLTAFTAGQMLALYEHRTVVQGFIWDINSFDQWGVELGKTLAGEVRSTMLAARRAANAANKPGHRRQKKKKKESTAEGSRETVPPAAASPGGGGAEGTGGDPSSPAQSPASSAAARASSSSMPLDGLNPSTKLLMERYLKGDGGYSEPDGWKLAPRALNLRTKADHGGGAGEADDRDRGGWKSLIRIRTNGHSSSGAMSSPTQQYFDKFTDTFVEPSAEGRGGGGGGGASKNTTSPR